MGLPVDPRGRELIKIINRLGYERWVAEEVNKVLNAAFQDVAGTLVRDYDTLTPSQRGRQAQLFSMIDKRIKGAYDEASTILYDQLTQYAGIESEVAVGDLRAMLPGATETLTRVTMGSITSAQARAIAEMPIAGLKLGDWWEKQANDMSLATRRAIQVGMINGESVPSIAARVLSSRATDATVDKAARRNATLLVRTSVTTVQNRAAFDTYKGASKDVSNSYRFLATKDKRTTPICRALDGQVFRYNDPQRKLPPQHINCRSTIVPELNWKKLGVQEPPKNSPLGFQDYSDWLKTQNEATQNDILTKPRADLWRQGKATLQDMVDTDGRLISIDQLRKNVEEKPIVKPPKPKPAPTPKPEPIIAPEPIAAQGKPLPGTSLDAVSRSVQEAIDANLKKAQSLVQEYNALTNQSNALWERYGGGNAYERVYADPEYQAIKKRIRDISTEQSGLHKELTDAIHDLISSGETGTIKVNTDMAANELAHNVEKAVKWLNEIVPTRLTDPMWEVQTHQLPPGARAYYAHADRTINVARTERVQVVVHEIAHSIEQSNPDLLRKIVAWRDARAANTPVQLLNDVAKGAGYRLDEVTRKDHFFNPYVGKLYQVAGRDTATEVLSMGLEELYTDPAGLYKRDKDMFLFILSLFR